MDEARSIQVMCHFSPDVLGKRRSNPTTSDQLTMLQTVFEQRPDFVRGCLGCLAWTAFSRGNIAVLDWVNQFGIELRSTVPIRDAVSRGGVKVLRWFSENGFEISDPDLLELAVKSGQLEAVRWLSEHGYGVNSLALANIAGKIRNVPILRWLVEHGPPLDLATATLLIWQYRQVEIAWWVSEDVRKHVVFEALQKNDRRVLRWILARTTFQDESAQWDIRAAIQSCSTDMQRWLEEDMSEVGACRWCFPTKMSIGGYEETALPNSKQRRLQ
ncbi:hypothetical protein PHYSODRAFT_303233 [Phytophthora sojae]|uniref:Uncharacterized protein n=1 Tax=Phytophthora sojae (strain P6497) TaxID=1094619 RepID=G4ZRN2_PHYSP|nr:hypothetical protein PHYSODRAFT_303233 [Phytophthora sojae]EGZ13841.1 hypothetical protein PHYSODRAFT_303233 [Phytophthora sojae]|eukprot:XP_009531270.1 hypothetical protein PHYSODRAFT_303233 [Phytophthora sojae]